MRKPERIAARFALALSATLAGCVGSSSGTLGSGGAPAANGSSTADETDGPATSSAEIERRPLSAQSVDAGLADLWAKLEDTMAIADAAVERSTNRCLAGTGFSYQTLHRGSDFRPGETPLPWYFELPDVDSSQPEADDVDDSLDPAFEQALYGNVVGEWELRPEDTTPAYLGGAVAGEIYDGCLPTAQIEIIGGGEPALSYQLIDFYGLLSGIEYEAVRRVVATPEYQEAQVRWRACVEASGHSIIRFEPDESVMTQPAPLTEDEVSTANQCSTQSGMTTIGDGQLEVELRDVWESQIGLVEDFRARLDAVRERSLAN